MPFVPEFLDAHHVLFPCVVILIILKHVKSDKSWDRIAKLLQKLQDAVVYLVKDAIHSRIPFKT